MKHSKKIGFGLTLVLAILALFSISFFKPSHVYAENISDSNLKKICVPPYTPAGNAEHHKINGWLSVTFVNRSKVNIQYEAKGNCATPSDQSSAYFYGNTTFEEVFSRLGGASGILELEDPNIDDGLDYRLKIGSDSKDDTRLDQIKGLSISDSRGGSDSVVATAALSQALQNAEITLGFEEDSVGDWGCGGDETADGNFVLKDGKDGNPPHWDCVASSDIGSSKGLLVGAENFGELDNFNVTYKVVINGSDVVVEHVASSQKGDRTFTFCGDGKFKNKNCNNSDLWLHGTQDEIKNIGDNKKSLTISDIDGKNGFNVTVAGQDNPAAATPTDPGSAAGSACASLDTCLNNEPDTSDCAANSNTSMEWLLCPLMTAMSKFADGINSFVESQLNFSVDDNLRDTGEINKAWTIIKNIVAALLVVIMLIMVISQAISAGPFDAYTVKKVLPRLVIGVIAMQFSWVLGKWAIGLANDVGVGLKQIMTAPFGGGGELDLPSIMNHLNSAYPAATSGWPIIGIMIVLLITYKEFILPFLLLIILSVGFALLTALATLVFRNILIIMAVIFAPVALLLWILPGQTMQGYWKKYTDNVIKLLLLFPLVIGLIYAGRIAAWLAGDLGIAGLIDYLIVLIAFFGPYFYLPKTFKWGGSLLAAANGAIRDNKTLNKGKEATNKGLWGWVNRSRGKRANDIEYDQPNLGFNKSFGANKWWNKRGPLRALTTKVDENGNRVGRGNPLLGLNGKAISRIPTGYILPTSRHRNLTKKLGKSWSHDRAEENEATLDNATRAFEKHGINPKQMDKFAKDLAKITGLNPTEAMELANKMIDPSLQKGGIGTGKWGSQILMAEAAASGNNEMLKAIARFHIQKKSNLEMANSKFMFPEMGRDGKVKEWVPFFDWSTAIDQQLKEPDLFAGMQALFADGAANNWRNGGAEYPAWYAMAGFAKMPNGQANPNFDPNAEHNMEWHKAFGGHTRLTTDRDGNEIEVIADPNEQPLDRPYIAWHAMNQGEGAFRTDLQAGGNRGAKALTMVNDVGEGKGFDKELDANGDPYSTEDIEAARTAVPLGAVQTVLKTLENDEGVNAMGVLNDDVIGKEFLKTVQLSGVTHFMDINGRVHVVAAEIKSSQDFLRIAKTALTRRQALQNKNPDITLPVVSPEERTWGPRMGGSPPVSKPINIPPDDNGGEVRRDSGSPHRGPDFDNDPTAGTHPYDPDPSAGPRPNPRPSAPAAAAPAPTPAASSAVSGSNVTNPGSPAEATVSRGDYKIDASNTPGPSVLEQVSRSDPAYVTNNITNVSQPVPDRTDSGEMRISHGEDQTTRRTPEFDYDRFYETARSAMRKGVKEGGSDISRGAPGSKPVDTSGNLNEGTEIIRPARPGSNPNA